MTAATDHWNATGKAALDAEGKAELDAMETKTLITTIAAEHGVSESSVVEMARGTLAHLVSMYEGDATRMEADLRGEDGHDVMKAGLSSFLSAYRRLTVRALTHPETFADAVRDILVSEESTR